MKRDGSVDRTTPGLSVVAHLISVFPRWLEVLKRL